MTDKPALKQRYFEDYDEGESFEFGNITVSEEEIIAFAMQFDPQPFHIDPQAAKESLYGGIIASGWHTGSLFMRSLVENFISDASLGSPGVDNMRWPAPVRAGDVLTAKVTVVSKRRSRSKPDRGILVSRSELFNQDKRLVMELTATNFMLCRP